MTFVLPVIRRSISAASMLSVLGSMSTNTGLAPVNKTELDVATKLSGVVIASSPRLRPAARHARWSAAVPLETATANFAPQKLASVASNSGMAGPWVSHLDFRTETTLLMSEDEID